MKTIKINRDIDGKELAELSKRWNAFDDVQIELPEDLSAADIKYITKICTENFADALAMAILSYVVDLNETPNNVLQEIYEKGDVGIKTAICLRDDIPNDLLNNCLESSEPNIIEHVVFNKAVSIEKCERLLAKTKEKFVRDAIVRAISIKNRTRI